MKYETGRLYRATVRGRADMLALRWDDHKWLSVTDTVDFRRLHEDRDVTDVRGPLVVLDLTDARVTASMLRAVASEGPRPHLEWLADQIEAQTKPAIPDEPTEWGATYTAPDGTQFVRVKTVGGHPWMRRDVIGAWSWQGIHEHHGQSR